MCSSHEEKGVRQCEDKRATWLEKEVRIIISNGQVKEYGVLYAM